MKKVVLAALLVIALSILVASPVFATANTKLEVIHDSAGNGTLDMLGPVAGFCNYNQDDAGNLRIVFVIKDGAANTTYQIFLVAGPSHAQATGYIEIGNLTTNEIGRGNSGDIWVPVSTLQAAPFGNGTRTDHVDAINYGPPEDVLCATPLNYTVPAP
jgi:hypothetical protein